MNLCDMFASHRWLWRLSPVHGLVAPREEFADVVEIRLGAAVVIPVTGCTRCGVVLTAFVCMVLLTHSLPQVASGYFEIRDSVLEFAHFADISVKAECFGFVPNVYMLRPTDIFCSAALPGRLAASDIGIVCP